MNETELEHVTETESYSPDWASIRGAAAVILALFLGLAVIGVLAW